MRLYATIPGTGLVNEEIDAILGYRNWAGLECPKMVEVLFTDDSQMWLFADEVFVEGHRPCDEEFGEHEHDDVECARILDVMNNGYGDSQMPNSGWYDYDAGLRWSDFVEGPIGD